VKDAKYLAFAASVGQVDRHTQIQGVADVDGIQWAGADWFMLHRYRERTLVAQRLDLNKSEAVGAPCLLPRVFQPEWRPSIQRIPVRIGCLCCQPAGSGAKPRHERSCNYYHKKRMW